MSEGKKLPPIGKRFEPGHTRGGAPIGNQNAKKYGMWKRAIMRALEKMGNGDTDAALDKLAMQLLRGVAKGNVHFVKELGDRLDGKAAQVIAGDPDAPIEIREIIIRAVDATGDRSAVEGDADSSPATH